MVACLPRFTISAMVANHQCSNDTLVVLPSGLIDPQIIDHRIGFLRRRYGIHLEAQRFPEQCLMLLVKSRPEQFRHLPSRLDEAQRRTPLFVICNKKVEIERSRIPCVESRTPCASWPYEPDSGSPSRRGT